MTHGFIGRPADTKTVRQDFEEFVAGLELLPTEKVGVIFGFAWGNEIYEHDWFEMELTGSELRSRVAEAETRGMGRIGSDDLYIRIPASGVEYQYCHEADVHVTAAVPGHPVVKAVRQRWLERGWQVDPCATS